MIVSECTIPNVNISGMQALMNWKTYDASIALRSFSYLSLFCRSTGGVITYWMRRSLSYLRYPEEGIDNAFVAFERTCAEDIDISTEYSAWY